MLFQLSYTRKKNSGKIHLFDMAWTLLIRSFPTTVWNIPKPCLCNGQYRQQFFFVRIDFVFWFLWWRRTCPSSCIGKRWASFLVKGQTKWNRMILITSMANIIDVNYIFSFPKSSFPPFIVLAMYIWVAMCIEYVKYTDQNSTCTRWSSFR